MKSYMKRSLKKIIGPYYRSFYLLVTLIPYRKRYSKILNRIRQQEEIRIVFFAMNVGMWKCDDFFYLLSKSKLFKPIIVSYLLPFDTEDYKKHVQDSMRSYFTGKDYTYYDSYNFNNGEWLDIRALKPDVIFYTQPYDEGYGQYRIKSLWNDCLFAYIPYCLQMGLRRNYYNYLLHNVAWKLFYPTEYHKKLGCKYSSNNGRNIVVTGLPMADSLICDGRADWDGWKQNSTVIKRIIWAPHHSIMEHSTLRYSNFLAIADDMLQLVKKYEGKVQFAFKPHPRLISRLYQHPEWGKERTDQYYETWKTLPNTIFVEGDYMELFKSSDAMIHDCSSFMGEYLYTGNPVMFMKRDGAKLNLNEFGKACFNQHYIGRTLNDVSHFIDNVVLNEADPMYKQRMRFFQQYLLPPNNKSVAENMYNEMKSLLI